MKWERTITVIGCHVGGEDNHVIVGGVLPPPGATMFERKRHLETHGDDLRRWLLHEPRGKPVSDLGRLLHHERAGRSPCFRRTEGLVEQAPLPFALDTGSVQSPSSRRPSSSEAASAS